MKAFVVAGLLFAFVRANAEDMRLTLDPVATHVKFILPDVLHTVHGEFTLKSGAIEFDPVTARASGAIVVDAASGESGSRGRDSRMHKNILESAMFPEITFVPDRVDGVLQLQGDSEVGLHGMFQMHGSSHAVTLPARVHINGPDLTAAIKFPVPYVGWGLKNPSTFILRVADTVQIEIQTSGHLSRPIGP